MERAMVAVFRLTLLLPLLASSAWAQPKIGVKTQRRGVFTSLPVNAAQPKAFEGLFLDRLIARLELFERPVPRPLARAAVEELELLAGLQPSAADDLAGAADILAARAAIALARSGTLDLQGALGSLPLERREVYEKKLTAAIDGWRRASAEPGLSEALAKLGKDLPLLSVEDAGKALDAFFTGGAGMAVPLEAKPSDLGSLPLAKPASALKSPALKTSDSDPARGEPEPPLSVFLRVLAEDAGLDPEDLLVRFAAAVPGEEGVEARVNPRRALQSLAWAAQSKLLWDFFLDHPSRGEALGVTEAAVDAAMRVAATDDAVRLRALVAAFLAEFGLPGTDAELREELAAYFGGGLGGKARPELPVYSPAHLMLRASPPLQNELILRAINTRTMAWGWIQEAKDDEEPGDRLIDRRFDAYLLRRWLPFDKVDEKRALYTDDKELLGEFWKRFDRASRRGRQAWEDFEKRVNTRSPDFFPYYFNPVTERLRADFDRRTSPRERARLFARLYLNDLRATLNLDRGAVGDYSFRRRYGERLLAWLGGSDSKARVFASFKGAVEAGVSGTELRRMVRELKPREKAALLDLLLALGYASTRDSVRLLLAPSASDRRPSRLGATLRTLLGDPELGPETAAQLLAEGVPPMLLADLRAFFAQEQYRGFGFRARDLAYAWVRQEEGNMPQYAGVKRTLAELLSSRLDRRMAAPRARRLLAERVIASAKLQTRKTAGVLGPDSSWVEELRSWTRKLRSWLDELLAR